MRDSLRRCCMVKIIMGISLAALLIPVAILAQDLNTKLKSAVRGDNSAEERLLAKNYDINAKNEYGWTGLTYASLHGHSIIVEMLLTKDADAREINANACRTKKKVERRIIKGWEDIKRSEGVEWVFNFVFFLLLLPGRIILWLFYSIGCILGL